VRSVATISAATGCRGHAERVVGGVVFLLADVLAADCS